MKSSNNLQILLSLVLLLLLLLQLVSTNEHCILASLSSHTAFIIIKKLVCTYIKLHFVSAFKRIYVSYSRLLSDWKF
jgi:hypothetical protein